MNTITKLFILQLLLFTLSFQSYAYLNNENGFGTELPKGIKASDVIKLMVPKIDTSLVTLVGMKKWPYRENTYVAIVCISRDKKNFSTDSLFSDGKPCCNAGYGGVNESQNPKIVYLSVIEYIDELKIIASYPGPLDVKTSWKFSNIESPNFEKDALLNPGNYDQFDFANYKISENQTAFGIRVGWRTMYSGGGGYFGALMLFVIQENKLLNILSEPIDEDGMSAGEWNSDGTRGKNFWQTHNILMMLPQKTSGYYDLQIKELDGKWAQMFKWSNNNNKYMPIEKGKNN